MKRKLIMLAALLALSGCSKAGGKSGTIECEQIILSSGSYKTFYSGKRETYVYEYTYKDKIIYTNISTVSQEGSDTRYELEVSESRYELKENCIFSRYVGCLMNETTCYLHLDSNTVEIIQKFSEFKYEKDSNDVEANGKEAYACAKQNFYFIDTSNYSTSYDYDTYGFSEYIRTYSLYLDENDSSLEKRNYIMCGSGSLIGYIPRG
ncbi:MAG: hypothetical protein K6E21_00930 [Bacilli bacterium]|nr:hypothetical protein [Bacilli bacterium]